MTIGNNRETTAFYDQWDLMLATNSRLEQENAKLREASEWQPIETIPDEIKQKECVLVCGGEFRADGAMWGPDKVSDDSVALVSYQPETFSEGFDWRGDNVGAHDEFYWYKPKYWMRMPKARDAAEDLRADVKEG